MKTISHNLRSAVISARNDFLSVIRKDPNHRFERDAYYLTIGGVLISMRPHRGWKIAYAAAKKVHSSAFFTRGSTLNKNVGSSQWESHKINWGIYRAKATGG